MKEEINKLVSFVIKDMLVFSSYKTTAVLLVLNSFFGAVSYSFFATNAAMRAVIETYGISFGTYLLVGMAFSAYAEQAMISLYKTMDPWLLEDIMVTPTKLWTIVLGSSIWPLSSNLIVAVVYLAVGSTIFGINVQIDIPATLLLMSLGLSAMIAFGLLSTSILVLTKQGEPLSWALGVLTGLFGNTFFPPEVMPLQLRTISYCLPQYYFFTSIRFVMSGRGISSVIGHMTVLLAMCSILVPLGCYAYDKSIKIAKRRGSLSWF